MNHSQIDELISNILKNGLIYDKPSKKGTSYFITEATNNDHEKAGDNRRHQYWKQQLLY